MKKSVSLIIAAVLLALLPTSLYSQSPRRVEAENLFVEAQKSLSIGDDAGAERLLKRSLKRDPDFTSAIWQLAQIYETRGNLEHARELLLRGLQQEPGANWAKEKLKRLEKILTQKLLSEAEYLMNNSNYTAALPKLSLYHGIKPYDPIPLIYIGRCHLAMDNPETAKEYLVQAYERDPSNQEISVLLGTVNERIESEARNAAIEKAKSILEDYSPDKYQMAKQALEDILIEDPSNSWARGQLDRLSELTLKEHEPAPVEEPEPEKEVTASNGSEGISINPVVFSVIKYILLLILAGGIGAFAFFYIRERSSRAEYPLQGSLNLIPILDIVSLINSNKKTGRLEIREGKYRGEIFFDKGEIIHARIRAKDGRQAFLSIMDISSGKYVFHYHLPKVRQTINEPLSLLLLSMKSTKEYETENGRKRAKVSLPV